MRKVLLLFSLLFLVSLAYSQTSLTYNQRTSNYYTGYNSGSAGIFDQGSYQVGMYANTSADKQSVYWRKFRTDAGGTSTSDRSLQIGDEFVVTISCTRAYGQIGFALLASPAATAAWSDRYNNYALQVNLDGPAYTGSGYGNWYIRYASDATSATSISGGTSFKNYTITMLLTAKDRMNITITDGTTTDNFYDIQLNSSNPITDYSIFLQDDWNGSSSENIYWGLGADATQHILTATGAVSIGASNSDFEISTAITDGLEASSSVNTSTNSFTKAGTGTLTISGSNTFSDNIVVSGGTLKISGSVDATNDVTVNASATMQVNTSGLGINNLTVNNTGTAEVLAGASLTMSGNSNNSGNFTLKSDGTGKTGNPTGSLIISGTITGDIDIQRNIDAYTGSGDGWHLISSPMTSFTVASSDFDPGSNDDLYYYDEPNDLWKNYKQTSFDFEKGKGYLCAYQTGEVKVFSGTPNNSNVSVTGLTADGSGAVTETGWNLVGNPFASAITWSNTWGSNIVATAKIYSESTGNYTDVSLGAEIPSMQGFFIQVTSSTSMTIPTSAQTHSSNSWSKQNETETLKLRISGGTNSFSDVSRIKFNEAASNDFDVDFDSHKLFGQSSAPQLYSNIDGELFSTNTFSTSEKPEKVEMNFRPGTTGEYILEVLENTISVVDKIYLEDKITGHIVDLSANLSYTFDAEVGDSDDRFRLHFSATGIEEVQKASLQAYVSGGQLYILGEEGEAELSIYNLQGQQLFNKIIVLNDQYSRVLDLKTGIYLVSLQTENNIKTAKVIIK